MIKLPKRQIVLSLKITVGIAALLAWFGVILPFLVSSQSNVLVLAGFLTTAFAGVFGILSVAQHVISYQMDHERKRR